MSKKIGDYESVKRWLEAEEKCPHAKVSRMGVAREWRCDECDAAFRPPKGYTKKTRAMYYGLMKRFCEITGMLPDSLLEAGRDEETATETLRKIGDALKATKCSNHAAFNRLVPLNAFWRANGIDVPEEVRGYASRRFSARGKPLTSQTHG